MLEDKPEVITSEVCSSVYVVEQLAELFLAKLEN